MFSQCRQLYFLIHRMITLPWSHRRTWLTSHCSAHCTLLGLAHMLDFCTLYCTLHFFTSALLNTVWSGSYGRLYTTHCTSARCTL